MEQGVNADFGQGWMSGSARDLFKILTLIAGADAKKLVAEINRIHRRRDANVNAATVLRAMGNLYGSKV